MIFRCDCQIDQQMDVRCDLRFSDTIFDYQMRFVRYVLQLSDAICDGQMQDMVARCDLQLSYRIYFCQMRYVCVFTLFTFDIEV